MDDETKGQALGALVGHGPSLWNTSRFTFETLRGQEAGDIHRNLVAYITEFSPAVRDIFIDKFQFPLPSLETSASARNAWRIAEHQLRLHPLADMRFSVNLADMSGSANPTPPASAEQQPPFLTTREVADLLRVKERKVYDLAAANEIPHRRITGKLLFPATEIMAWIDGGNEAVQTERPAVLTGSHDPLLDWAIRESGSELSTLWNGSLDGLQVYAEGRAALTGLHVPEDDGWNVQTVGSRSFEGCVLIAWATRSRGLLVAPCLDGRVRRFSDIKGQRVVRRQPGAGAAALLEALMEDAGMSSDDIVPVSGLARTETDAAAIISAGDADAALGIEAMAKQFHLGFVPLRQERFDLLIDRRSYFTHPVQTLLSFARTGAFCAKAEAMGGYAVEDAGVVRWLGP